MNAKSYLKHLRGEWIPTLKHYFTFVQDSAPSHHANKVRNFLKQKLKSRFIKNTDWPPSSPDCDSLDYYLWDRVQEKVFAGRHCNPFQSPEGLKDRIVEVWEECA